MRADLQPPSPERTWSSPARLLLELRGYQMEREGAHSISGGFSAGRIGSIHSNGDRLELIAERYGSHHTICQVG